VAYYLRLPLYHRCQDEVGKNGGAYLGMCCRGTLNGFAAPSNNNIRYLRAIVAPVYYPPLAFPRSKMQLLSGLNHTESVAHRERHYYYPAEYLTSNSQMPNALLWWWWWWWWCCCCCCCTLHCSMDASCGLRRLVVQVARSARGPVKV
jgi:hypothetical protein